MQVLSLAEMAGVQEQQRGAQHAGALRQVPRLEVGVDPANTDPVNTDPVNLDPVQPFSISSSSLSPAMSMQMNERQHAQQQHTQRQQAQRLLPHQSSLQRHHQQEQGPNVAVTGRAPAPGHTQSSTTTSPISSGLAGPQVGTAAAYPSSAAQHPFMSQQLPPSRISDFSGREAPNTALSTANTSTSANVQLSSQDPGSHGGSLGAALSQATSLAATTRQVRGSCDEGIM